MNSSEMGSELPARELPLYSPSPPSPSYSQDPAYDETRLDLSPRMATPLLPTGVFAKTSGSATVVLFDQESNIPAPVYGRRATVRGTLVLDQDTRNISEVVVKLEGQLETATMESGSISTRTLSNSYSIWSSASSPFACPRTMEFAYPLPATFQYQGSEYPLPPSYVARFPGLPSLFARCIYSLTISIAQDGRFMSRTKTIYFPIDYKPQTSPPRGIIYPTSCFLSTLKTTLDEWSDSSFTMRTRCSSALPPIQCQLFLPSVKIFGLSDTIPLHLQMFGTLSSLRKFILPSDIDQDGRQRSSVRVYITRMVSVEYRGKSTWRVQRIGEGRVWPLPPSVDFDCDCPPVCTYCDSHEEFLDWDGEVRCDPHVTVGGFQATGLTVKDFIMLELTPPKPVSSPLLTVQHAIPIRLVTDTFVPPT
ncbi:hypothetical protein B0H11DRAFT_1814903 [Mycena galericulata]|nr:hypothetical protein B0H11DRAFT_1814903 [Mycena galericulata]